MTRILSVASEAAPLIKTGGLADVAGALPSALAALGAEMRVLLPAYPGLLNRAGAQTEVWRDDDLFGGSGRVLAADVDGAPFLLLDAPHLYDRSGGPYLDASGVDYADNHLRFAALSWAAARMALDGVDGWRPDAVHVHDWQAGLTPAYLRAAGSSLRCVTTIHNIAFQGWVDASHLWTLRLPAHMMRIEGLEYHGGISMLKAGLVYADAVTTVSPTYAEELMRPAFGMGLEGVIAARAADLHGILNGVDLNVWNPETCAFPYSAQDMSGKAAARAALCAEFGLAPSSGPLAIVVSRLSEQKGLDLLAAALPDFVEGGGSLALLGSGAPDLERKFRDLAARRPERVGARIGYDEALSRLMFAGGDAVLVPSRFEPCGLTQLYGLRFGAVPLVTATGGLNDTVVNASPAALAAGVATGVVAHPTDALALRQALRRLTALYRQPDVWEQMRRNGMKQPIGWETSAQAYLNLYQGRRAS